MGDQIGKGGFLSGTLSEWRIRKALPHLHGTILDFGCGRGNLAYAISPERYIGVDDDEESLQIARKLHPHHQFYSAIPARLTVDCIVALAVLEHIPNAHELLKQFKSALKRDGRIVLTTPHPGADKIHTVGARLRLFSREAREQHVRLYNRRALSDILAGTGFDISLFQPFMLGANQLIVLSWNEGA